MINILLIILLINSILNFRRKPKALNCGLWCYSGNEPADGMKMKLLAIYNQIRGDHATGICIDNDILKETVTAREFVAKHAVMFDFKTLSKLNNTVLGHCRQASTGYNKEKVSFAHPHAFPKAEGEADFIYLVHNGSITNVSDLCHKYGIEMDFQENSDSIVFGKIVAKLWAAKDHNIFLDYEGSATVVFYPKNMKNTIFVHKDKERDLFYWNETPNKVYISSIKDSLLAIGADEVKEFKAGILTKFTNGHITQEWDLSAKTPYSKPKIHSRPRITKYDQVSGGASVTKRGTDGFYWDNHNVCYNGHLYTGSLFLEKNGRRVEKSIPAGENEDKFTEYFVVNGIVTRDKGAYKQLFSRCAVQNELKPELFKKILNTDLASYSLYPVFGKHYSDARDLFWFPGFLNMKVDDSYTWSPILSNKEFSCNRAGFKMKEVTLAENFMMTTEDDNKLTAKESVTRMINLIAYRGGIYEAIPGFYRAYLKFRKIDQQPNTYSLFIDAVIEAVTDFGYVDKADLDLILKLRVAENYDYEEKDNPWQLESCLSNLLSETCKGERAAHIQNIAGDENPDPPEEDSIIESIDEDHSDKDWFHSEEFKSSLLFSSYTSLQDAAENYGTLEGKYYDPEFLSAVNNLIYDVGIITTNEHLENKTAIKNKHLLMTKSKLEHAFTMLIEEPFYRELMTGFSGSDIDLEGKIADIYKSIQILEHKKSVSIDDEIRLKIYKLALSYISSGDRVNKEKLLSKHNLSISELTRYATTS